MNCEGEMRDFQRILLDEAVAKGIQRNDEQCKVWMRYKNDHQKVVDALCNFQKDLYVNCMVPIGKRALMKGKLIHTNEVLACLGDGYFAKYSASGAMDLCKRRIQQAEEMLTNLGKERNLFETRMMVIENDLFEDCAGREIVEHWNEDQIKDWKLKHREKEREYHQKLAKLKQEEIKKIETEEDLFHRLDQLELEEELADEFDRLEDKQHELYGDEFEEDEYYYESEDSSETKEENTEVENECTSNSEKTQFADIQSCKIKKSVSFVEQKDNVNTVKVRSSTTETKDTSENIKYSEDDILKINFTHSQNNPIIKSDGDSIETPADIYRVFSKPKSILKRSPNDIAPQEVPPPDYSTEEEEEEGIKSSAYESLVKDIKERNTTTLTKDTSTTNKDTRPVSKFKRDRQVKQ